MAIRTVSNYLRLTKKQYKIIDTLAYHSKSLYNVALYNIRQHYFEYRENAKMIENLRPDDIAKGNIMVGSFLPYTRNKKYPYKDICNYAQSKPNENYGILHSSSAQQTIKSVEEGYKSYFELMQMYRKGELKDRPNSPYYLKKNGRYKLSFPISVLKVKRGYVTIGISHLFKKQHNLTGKELTFKIPPHIKHSQIREVTLLPIHGGKTYKIEFSYKTPVEPATVNPTNYLAIDLGVNNFATAVASNGTAFILDGKYLKSINRWYNKEIARLQSIKDKQGLTCDFTKRQSRITIKRDNKINEAMNLFVKYITDHAVQNRIGTIVLPTWGNIKQNSKLGKRGNQNFVDIPYAKFRLKLKSKCELLGIIFDDSKDEAYTSQVDALACDPIKKPSYGKTRRVKRGLYQSTVGVLINADVNGAINHMRKVAGDSVVQQIISSGRVNRPVRIRFCYEQTSHELNCNYFSYKPPALAGGC